MDFYPNKGVQTFSGTSTMSLPAMALPSIADTMFIMAKDNNYSVVGAHTVIPNGCDVIVLEVKALKKAKTVLEYGCICNVTHTGDCKSDRVE